MKLTVISGGQSGADSGALRAAKTRNLPTAGFAPKGFLTEDGPRPELGTEYGLIEMPTVDYPARTRANVQMATAVLWFGNPHSPGGKLTLSEAVRHNIDSFVVLAKTTPSDVARWLVGTVFPGEPSVALMVAGNRESKNPGIGSQVERFMGDVFDILFGEQPPCNAPSS